MRAVGLNMSANTLHLQPVYILLVHNKLQSESEQSPTYFSLVLQIAEGHLVPGQTPEGDNSMCCYFLGGIRHCMY